MPRVGYIPARAEIGPNHEGGDAVALLPWDLLGFHVGSGMSVRMGVGVIHMRVSVVEGVGVHMGFGVR